MKIAISHPACVPKQSKSKFSDKEILMIFD